MKKNENKKYILAFPCLDNNDHSGQIKLYSEGMTLRDYFAAKAMQGELSSQPHNDWANETDLAQRAYLISDAMLKERTK